MKSTAKVMTAAAAAALITLTAAAPAEAQYRDRYRNHDRGIDAGDVIAGVAIVGGIAAIASAIGNNGYRSSYGSQYGYGYGSGYGSGYGNAYGYGPEAAVNACSYQAQRYGRGRVSVTDVDRRGSRSYRVRGVIDNGYNGYGYGRYDSRTAFQCTARDNGRVSDFDIDRY